MTRTAWALGIAALICAPACAAQVEFVVNDALLKDEPLPQVTVRVAKTERPNAAALVQGLTDAEGKFSADLQPGTYYVSYSKPGYVRIQRTPTVITAAAGQVVVTSLAMSLEAEGLDQGTKRLKIVLNWGSDPSAHPSDLDSHLLHLESGTHVYFAHRQDPAVPNMHLDVDDVDWGGPETITLTDPPPGTYYYWVHNYSSTPALHGSQAVVRVISGDTLQAEYRPQAPVDETLVSWRPFAVLHVTADSISVTDWIPEELAQDPTVPYRLPPGVEDHDAQQSFAPNEPVELGSVCCAFMTLLIGVACAALGLRSFFKS